jgi:hypothetical protein
MPQLAQLNVALLRHPLDHPDLEPFVSRLDEVNAQADAAPGLRPWGEEMIVNLSVWDGLESLRAYVYAPGHVEVLRARRRFFVPMGTPHLVLWWVPDGHRPTLEEARERLTLLERNGPGPDAFTLAAAFPAGAVQGP